ncbi:hypothetical protein NEA10_20520 (plasmid) [Phormidium yuhuli AB48]|uniref:Uncharacterized protein n=1 Tax=Phormidium yuhuli AB48 TaxID=2940671 RepID=A0ABY5AWW5_9CYAN|nr:hypothetical protein [Phormidium yuhuli]USR93292.1 hypothetical protein NEA10_20520 [Phormidium yuhuli AB48]
MNQDTIDRLRASGQLLQKFRELRVNDREFVTELLQHSRSILTAIALIEELENAPNGMTYQELAEAVGIHPNTAKQILLAIGDDVGIENQKSQVSIAKTGRQRNLLKKRKNPSPLIS